MFAQASAASAPARRTAALPVSVRRNSRSGVSRLRVQAVRPVKGAAVDSISVTPGFCLTPEPTENGSAYFAAVVGVDCWSSSPDNSRSAFPNITPVNRSLKPARNAMMV